MVELEIVSLLVVRGTESSGVFWALIKSAVMERF